MSEEIYYGNDYHMIKFNVRVTEKIVKTLWDDGYLEEDEFNEEDLDHYYMESDARYAYDIIRPVLDALIDWYDDKVDDEDSKIMESGRRDEWTEEWEDSTDLQKICIYADIIENFDDAVQVREVPPQKLI